MTDRHQSQRSRHDSRRDYAPSSRQEAPPRKLDDYGRDRRPRNDDNEPHRASTDYNPSTRNTEPTYNDRTSSRRYRSRSPDHPPHRRRDDHRDRSRSPYRREREREHDGSRRDTRERDDRRNNGPQRGGDDRHDRARRREGDGYEDRNRNAGGPAKRGLGHPDRERERRSPSPRQGMRNGNGDDDDRGYDRPSRDQELPTRGKVSDSKHEQTQSEDAKATGESRHVNESDRSKQAEEGNGMDVDAAAGEDGAEEDDGMTDEMRAMMGFGGFGTTKGKKVAGNNVGGVRKEKKSEYRQYMNRVGGFNRPLSPSR